MLVKALLTVFHFLVECNGTLSVNLHSTCYITSPKQFHCYTFDNNFSWLL